MEQTDYKELYEQAKERAKHKLTYAQVEEIFPELESEDEKIRKFLYKTFTAQYLAKDKLGKWHGEPVTNILAWLEKKAEQKPDVIIPKFRVGDVIRPKGSTAEYTIESISGECYHGKGWGLHISGDDDYELVEQKHAWSEEDERKLQLLIVMCDETKGDSVTYSTMYREMEELKTWLKSLRPQSTWKPSDEQMNALEAVLTVSPQSPAITSALLGLYEQLKKLKE